MKTPTDLMELAGVAAVVQTAMQEGLVEALLETPGTAEAIARQHGFDPEATALLLEALTAIGLAEAYDGRYAPGQSLTDYARMMPGGLGFINGLWGQLPGYLKTGSRQGRMDGAIAHREEAYKTVVSGLAKLFGEAAEQVAERVPGGRARILDVGAGSGVWSLEMARRHDHATVTALDLPHVLPNFLARAEALGLGNRVETLAGSFHEVDLPARGFDRIVLANVLHLENGENAAKLLKRLRPALADQGDVVVIDALASGTPDRDLARSIYALHLTLRTRQGRNHPRTDLEQWCREAGLEPVEMITIDAHPKAMGALVCRPVAGA